MMIVVDMPGDHTRAALFLQPLFIYASLSSAASARDRHILLAVFSLLLSCFIQVLVFTYLTITGKVIAQAVHLARLDPRHPLPSQGSQTIFYRLSAISGETGFQGTTGCGVR